MPIHGYPGNIITANPTAPTVSAASGVWTTEQQLQAVSQGNWPGYEYPISRSLRFNSADSAYLNRTPASASNRTTWTFSYWFKGMNMSNGANDEWALSAFSDGNNYTAIRHHNGYYIDVLSFNGGSAVSIVKTVNLFRDPSAWNHFVIVFDTSNATQADRVKIFQNGVRCSIQGGATYPGSGSPTGWVNSTASHNIGRQSSEYFNGYMTEVNLIDGQALTPSSFGLNDPETGIWSPKQYTGTYGTNGFFLSFSDNSNTTSTTLGKDYSGNGNNWTPNNFSVTAGAGNDSLVDTPTSYGSDSGLGAECRGNYATLNPLAVDADVTLSNGNLDFSCTSAGLGGTIGTIAVSSGKWYWEVTVTGGTASAVGIAKLPLSAYDANQTGTYLYLPNGDKRLSPSTDSAYGASYTTNDVIGVALDMDAGTVVFYKNNSSQGTAFSSLSGTFTAWIQDGTSGSSSTFVTNFGQRPFAYTAPSGFKALCTQNLPTPTIGATSTTQANDYFNTVLYTGNGSTQSITGVGFQPDFVWIKNRGTATDHGLFDAIRGTTKRLSSNLTSAETTEVNSLTAFNSDGFSVGATQDFNQNTVGIVAWNWKANGAGSSNTQGTITSTVSANTTAGFSIVTYTGTGVNATVGHGLGVVPSMIIAKRRSAAQNWGVAHSALTGTQTLYLDLTQGVATGVWNGTPTSTVFNITTDGVVNASGSTYVAYCFAPIAGYSAFGSYTGNGSTDGPFVYTGFRPRWVMFKKTSATSNWSILDTSRDDFNVADNPLLPNLSNAESTSTSTSGAFADILSNGFKARGNSGDINDSGATYIYAAFAESPFKYALAR